MNSDTRIFIARAGAIALLTLLPSRLGASWPESRPAGLVAWRAAKRAGVTLRIGVREFTFLHSLDAERSARLVVECRCGIVARAAATECYRKLLALQPSKLRHAFFRVCTRRFDESGHLQHELPPSVAQYRSPHRGGH